MRTSLCLAALLVLASALPVSAQTTTLNPSTVTFTASPDHTTTLGGTAVLTSYVVEVYDGASLVKSTDVGKPTPAANGDITVPLSSQSLAKNKVFTAQVAAVGPGGTSRSAPSNPFAYPGAPAAASSVRVQ